MIKHDSVSRQNINPRNSLQQVGQQRGMGTPFPLHGKYMHDFIQNNTLGNFNQGYQNKPLIKQNELITTAKLVQEQFFA